MDQKKKSLRDRIGGALLSVRTRYALMTAFFLLLAMAMFYACGRIVLMHFIRDAEQQMKAVGQSISTLAYRQAEQVQLAATRTLNMREAATAGVRALLTDFGQPFSLVADFGADGRFRAGVARKALTEPVEGLAAEDFAEYAEILATWAVATRADGGTAPRNASTGIVRIGGQLHYAAMLPRGDGCLMFGMPFTASSFSAQGMGGFGGFEIRISDRRPYGRASHSNSSKRSYERSSYGIAPMLSEAMDFYSGGFWKLNENQVDAIFAIRDIAGNSITTVSVSLPKTFSGATRIAVGRLAVFVAVFGMFFVIPLFWAQNRLLMNPLSKMIQAIREMGEHSADIDCPRLEWKGKDEFAQLAESVNRMVEMIAAKTVSLANVEASHQALIDGVPDALAVFDLQGRLVSISKQPEGVPQLPGFFPGEPPAAAVFGDETVRGFATALEEVFRTGEIRKARLKVQRPIGVSNEVPTRHFEVRLTRLSERFALAIVRDVSAEVAEHKLRLAAEQRALDASKRESLTGFAAGIAHDMNNVLSVVLSAAEARDADPSGDSLRTLNTIRDAVRKGSSMMRELRTFAGENRMTLMRAQPKLVLEDVRPLASRVVAKNVELTIESSADVPDVDIDPNQFWKVFFNIIKNASEAIGDRPGHIALDAVPFAMTEGDASDFLSEHPLSPGPGVLFRIADDGSGIPPDILGRLFDPYVSSKSLGRGLGLATVRTIVEAHGGGIRVKSKVDEGTTFLIYLPESKLPVPAATEGSSAPEQSAPSGDVLVVDNDEPILKTSSILLKALKLTPHVARDRREALAVVRRYSSQLRAIILDAHLGGIDTVRLLGAFRIGAPNVPVIVASGSSDEEIEKMFRAHPYDAFLAKPYTLDELTRMLASFRRT